MSVERTKRQMEKIKKARNLKAGRSVTVRTKLGKITVTVHTKRSGRALPKARSYGEVAVVARGGIHDSPQPRPKIPLLSGGKDSTLGERFEEELYRS